jgi:DNA-binding FadR family transcriptional regulator
MALDLDPPRSGSAASEPKLAQRVAAEIERDIADGVRQVGESLGTEHDLVARYGVSRSVLREALTLVTWSGLAEMRRGKTGGLVVTTPSEATTAWGLHSYLDFVVADISELLALRRDVEELAVTLAIQRLSAADLPAFQALDEAYDRASDTPSKLGVGSAILHQITATSRNPMLSLLLSALSGLMVERMSRRGSGPGGLMAPAEAISALRLDVLHAVMGAASGRAFAACAQAFDSFAEMAAAPPGPVPTSSEELAGVMQIIGVGGAPKLAEKVAQRIRARMVSEGLGAGAHLGSEVELMTAHGVSRGVVREAIRILERLSVVTMVRGKGGGLRALAPDSRPIVRRTAAFLRAKGVRQHHLEEVATMLGLAAAEKAARDPAAANRVATLLPRIAAMKSGSLKDLAFAYFGLVKTLSGGGAIGVVIDILAELYGAGDEAWAGRGVVKSVAPERVAELAEAVRAGHPALARRRMVMIQRSGAVVRSPAAP